MKTQSALPWYGTDSSVAKDIGELLDAAKHVTIPFCGGLGILPHLKARSVLANDKHKYAIEFYRCLKDSDTRDELLAMCKETLCHPAELSMANALGNGIAAGTRPMHAWAYWTRCWLGRKGAGGTPNAGKTASIRRNANGGNNASRLRSAAGDLDEWAALLERVEFECKDFRDVLAKVHDDPKCGIYCDPPWIKEGGLYEHAFSLVDHRDLATILDRFHQSPIIVRYGDDPLIRALYPEPTWTWIEAESRNQANAVRGEVWITRNLDQ